MMKKSAKKAAGFSFNFLDNEYGASSYDSAFSADIGADNPRPRIN